jgi:hypothetical protein
MRMDGYLFRQSADRSVAAKEKEAGRGLCFEKASRLYEQKRRAVSAATALEMYVRRWLMWATGGILCPLHGGDPCSRYDPQNNVMSACRAFTLL